MPGQALVLSDSPNTLGLLREGESGGFIVNQQAKEGGGGRSLVNGESVVQGGDGNLLVEPVRNVREGVRVVSRGLWCQR